MSRSWLFAIPSLELNIQTLTMSLFIGCNWGGIGFCRVILLFCKSRLVALFRHLLNLLLAVNYFTVFLNTRLTQFGWFIHWGLIQKLNTRVDVMGCTFDSSLVIVEWSFRFRLSSFFISKSCDKESVVSLLTIYVFWGTQLVLGILLFGCLIDVMEFEGLW